MCKEKGSLAGRLGRYMGKDQVLLQRAWNVSCRKRGATKSSKAGNGLIVSVIQKELSSKYTVYRCIRSDTSSHVAGERQLSSLLRCQGQCPVSLRNPIERIYVPKRKLF